MGELKRDMRAEMEREVFQLIVVGGGSGGVASARKAASLGIKVALIEDNKLGGTCVNVGCVPKKVMWNTSQVHRTVLDAKGYGFSYEKMSFDFKKIKQARDNYVTHLNGIYDQLLRSSKVTVFRGLAKFVDQRTVQVNSKQLSSEHIILAVGGMPLIPNIPGAEHGLTSDTFFQKLDFLPKRTCIVGAGYVALELASLLCDLGSEVTLVIRQDLFLRAFDKTIIEHLESIMLANGVKIVKRAIIQKVEKVNDTCSVYAENAKFLGDFEAVIWAIGRTPRTAGIGLERIGIKTRNNHSVFVDEYQNTNIPGIYAIGDVTSQVDLTPVAIAAGRRLVRRIFNHETNLKLDYENIPTVIFTHPPIGTVGMSQEKAIQTYGEKNIQVYTTSFVNSYYAVLERKEKTLLKVVTLVGSDKILGLHMVGLGADEIIQGFSVAIKMGATLHNFNETIAIHPTASEEFVLIEPLKPKL